MQKLHVHPRDVSLPANRLVNAFTTMSHSNDKLIPQEIV